jgi:lysozyme
VDWNQVKSSGAAFAFAKSSEGMGFTDHKFSANWAAMKAAGLVRGAYHYGLIKEDAVAQAKRFYKLVQPTHGDLPLVLDLEGGGNDNQTPAAFWSWTQAFLGEIESLTGRPAIIYVGGFFWHTNVGNPKDNLNCSLWLADHTHKPHIPLAWKDWTFLQYTDKGKVAGVKTNVDRDYFNGTLADLLKLTLP